MLASPRKRPWKQRRPSLAGVTHLKPTSDSRASLYVDLCAFCPLDVFDCGSSHLPQAASNVLVSKLPTSRLVLVGWFHAISNLLAVSLFVSFFRPRLERQMNTRHPTLHGHRGPQGAIHG